MWHELITETDISGFMEDIGCFHDGCVKEMHYLSGAYVTENLGMYPLNDRRILRLVIQRQFQDPSMVELEFRGLKKLQLVPVGMGYTCELSGSVLLKKDGLFWWCDWEDVTSDDLDTYDGTLICAEALRWRPIENTMGPEAFYRREN